MKSIFKKNRIVFILFFLTCLVYSGCSQESSSSGTSDPDKMVDINSIKVTFSPDGDLEFGDGDGMGWTRMSNGHTQSFSNGNTVSSIAGVHTRSVRFTNMDPDEYMANVYIYTLPATCPSCSGAIFDNADFCNGFFPVGACTAYVDGGSGFSYVEDGDFVSEPEPWNPKGAELWPSKGGEVFGTVRQIIHPECGTVSTPWIFSNNNFNYEFYIGIQADYFPWGDMSDPRYDMADRSTFYAVVSANDDAYMGSHLYYGLSWRQGTPQRSTVLSGYNGPGTSGITGLNNLATGTPFGVVIGVEYPDRIEAQVQGNVNTVTDFASGYEYYTQVSTILRYNENVVNVLSGPNDTSYNSSFSTSRYRKNNNFTPVVFSGGSDGWVAMTYSVPATWSFSNINSYIEYRTSNGGRLYFGPAQPNLCMHCGQRGVAKFNVTTGVDTSVWTTLNPDTILTQDGVDEGPDLWLAHYAFEVDAGAEVGSGSEFWFDTYEDGTGAWLNHTKGSFWDSGTNSNDDWTTYCYPMNPANMNDVEQGCGTDDPTRIINGTEGERSNYEILHSGKGTPRLPDLGSWGYPSSSVGGYQQWPAHICVQ
jgi:hypothetical protein